MRNFALSCMSITSMSKWTLSFETCLISILLPVLHQIIQHAT